MKYNSEYANTERDRCLAGAGYPMLIDPYMSDFKAHLEAFEGRVLWMYLDSGGNVTCGVGHLISSPEAAAELPFTGGDPREDWCAVKEGNPGLRASDYENITVCRLSDSAIDSIRDSDVAVAEREVEIHLDYYGSLPQTVQQACLDMSFNLGVERLMREYFGAESKFGPALERKDWAAAAKECHRNGIQPARNSYTENLILTAHDAANVSMET